MLFSFMPDLTGFKEMGFSVKTYNGDLYVEKETDSYKIRFSQGYEPFHPELGRLVDFEIPDGFIMISLKARPSDDLIMSLNEVGQLFQQHHLKENYFFLFNNKLDFGTPGVAIKMKKIVDILEKFFDS